MRWEDMAVGGAGDRRRSRARSAMIFSRAGSRDAAFGVGTCVRDRPGTYCGRCGAADGFARFEPVADGDDSAGWEFRGAAGAGGDAYAGGFECEQCASAGIREARLGLEQRWDELCAVPGEPDGDGHLCERGGRNAHSGDGVFIAIGQGTPLLGVFAQIFRYI